MNVNKMLIKINKIIAVVFLISIVFNTMLTISIENTAWAEGLANKFEGTSNNNGETIPIIKKIVSGILLIVRNVGVTIALGMLVIIATKYIMASAGEKADIKKSAVAYVVGALVMFSASGIAQIIKKFIDSAFEAA